MTSPSEALVPANFEKTIKGKQVQFRTELPSLLSSCRNQNLLESKAKKGSVLIPANHDIIDRGQTRQNKEKKFAVVLMQNHLLVTLYQNLSALWRHVLHVKRHVKGKTSDMQIHTSTNSTFAITSCPTTGEISAFSSHLT